MQWELPGIRENDPSENSLEMRNREPERTIFCNEARLPVEELGHQASLKAFDLEYVLPSRCAEVKVVYNS